jgi:eukaryotic-like serine/threonine-protein kinase
MRVHPPAGEVTHIVQIHEVGECEGRPFLVLEYLEGGSLASKLDGTPWAPRDAAALVGTLARAVHAAHQKHVVHRDLKPGNVLLAADGTPKVADFGLAKKLDADSAETQAGAVLALLLRVGRAPEKQDRAAPAIADHEQEWMVRAEKRNRGGLW